ncbi:Type 1 glutamine amidotransferase-like domain-containing protein [Alkalihalobacillus sp. CinArs1]|uniref:Type 1 glutamine amidotransferase-like domain-containing protein n=1 Tax=Alkalihalobacillus sp. CinArs1 TaxID=2995314 RepID=UPI0022DE6FC3|nr:Type 1 glutamine amidotransferase-like domain-containing protein [Alkalihalobacillus sp. CinArs1]
MKTHYYLGWFTNFFPERLGRLLQKDITDRKSIAMISSNPSKLEDDGATECSWLDQAGILFDDYHLINYRVHKEEAQTIIQNASVIFLLGGDPLTQNGFLREYELMDSIKKSSAIVLGASAGAFNMSTKWLCSKNLGFNVGKNTVYKGIGLDNFSVLSHFDLENNIERVQSELSPLSEEITIYASNKDCAVRVKGDRIDVFGTAFLISNSKIRKLKETL